MKRALLLTILFLVALFLSVKAYAVHPCAAQPTIPECQYLNSKVKGRLFIYETDGMRCSLYINENGMAAGAGGAACISWPTADEFRVIRVILTEDGGGNE